MWADLDVQSRGIIQSSSNVTHGDARFKVESVRSMSNVGCRFQGRRQEEMKEKGKTLYEARCGG